ncbi:MAG TPA: LLM class F420-dependent oxidoreductase [Candidatus Binatia bacterium]|jgi:probable F420-dependent oxidoreductase
MRLGVVMPYWLDRPVLEAAGIGETADRLGYGSLWIGEMLTFDAFALAGALARTTARIAITVGPLPVATRDPAALALGVASVSALGGRPAHLALGASTPAVVERWHGRRWQPTVARVRECVAAVRPILAGERSRFAGAHTATDGFRLAAGPQPGTTIAVAAFGARMIALAATIADRAVANLVTVAQLARIREALDAAARAAGTPPPPLTVWVPAALGVGERALAELRRQLVLYVGAPGYGEMFADAGHGDVVALARSGAHPRAVAEAVTPELIRSVCVSGDAASVRAGLAAYGAAGADEVAVVPVTAEDTNGERLLRALAPA